MARLIVEKGHDKGQSIPLPSRATTVFGRDTSANVQIKDTMASRAHFKIEPRADGLWLVDLKSLNGTLLNGHPCTESKLSPGDLVRVGETTYSFVPEDAGTDPLVGQRLGGYKLIERVGRGGMGTVYKAEQVDLQRIVALKIISEEHLKNPEFVELFVHEARAAAKLNHTNIVQVYDVKKSNELYYFSMEFVPGGSVQDLLNTRRKLPIGEAVRMIIEAARGLEYAHRKEIIHRDVKPDNLMLGEGASIKIGDLGLAQRLGEKLAADNADSVIGTPHYIAPEQVLGRPADIRSDVYSLGSTLFRMVAGFTPFQAPTIRELVNRKAREDAAPLHVATSDVPESLGVICARMMARLPEERTPNMTEVIRDLEAWSRPATVTTARETPHLNKRLLVTAVALLAVVVVGGVIAATTMFRKGPPPASGGPTADLAEPSGDVDAKFDRAAAAEDRLKDQKPDEFDEVIQLYDAIVTRWPNTNYARDATERRDSLKKRRLGLMAARGLDTLIAADRESWKLTVQNFHEGREDYSETGRRLKDFEAFAADPAWSGTDAAREAGRHAATVKAWIAEADKRKSVFAALRGEVDKLTTEHRYRDASEACNRFVADIASYVPSAKDRYSTLLFDLPSRRLLERIAGLAAARFEEVSRAAAEFEGKGDFAKAVEALEPTVRDSLQDPSRRAKDLVAAIHQRWSAANQLAAQKAAEDQRRVLETDQRDFEAAARRWREAVLRFDPRSALVEAEALRAEPSRFPRLPSTEARIAARVAPLRILADFKDLFVRSFGEKPAGLSTRITLGTVTGTIEKATEDRLTISFGAGSQSEVSFAEVIGGGPGSPRAAQFLDYLRNAWKKGDARWHMGAVILAFELGLYERALEGIAAMEKLTDEAARRFAAEYRPLAEELKFPDSDEIEAQKHFDRISLALADGATPRFDIAKGIQILRTRFGGSAFVAANKSRLDEIEKERLGREERERDRTVRAERFRKLNAQRGKFQGEVKARESEVTRTIQNIKDPLERGYALGESLLGFGKLQASTTALSAAFEEAYRKFPPPERRANPNDPIMLAVARLGGSLMRNYSLQRSESRAGETKRRIDEKFDFDYFPWTWAKTNHDQWATAMGDRLKKHGDRLVNLEKEFQENPDPKLMYELCEGHEILKNFIDVRGLANALLVEFPEFEKVRSGDALHKMAEASYHLRDVVKAEEFYTRLKTEYPTHAKVVQAGAFDSVDNRLQACAKLRTLMGLPK